MWTDKQRYAGRGIPGQIALRTIPTTGTAYIDAVLVALAGPQAGQQIRYRGFVNTRENAERTIGELRAMGWTGTKFGEWRGFGAKDCSFVSMLEFGNDKKNYFKACFIRPPQSVGDSDPSAVFDANKAFGDLLTQPGAPSNAPDSAPAPAMNGAATQQEELAIEEEAIPF